LPCAGSVFFLLGACLFAALLAAAPARGSSPWLHLAAGRAVLTEGLFPAHDPLSYAGTHGGPGATWLFDVVVYGLHQAGGERSVMAAHALGVLSLALFITIAGWSGHDGWLPALCAVLALLAMAAWLAPGPLAASALLLAVLLFLLEGDEHTTGRARWPWLVPLWALFPVWACIDSWFVLGLLVLLLRTAGAAIQLGPGSGRVRTLLLALGGGLLASLLQPRHLHAFALPVQLGLSGAARALRDSAAGVDLVVSPLQPRFWTGAGQGASAGAWAALLAGGALSFLLNRRRLDLGRLLVWLAAAGLCLYQARTMPLFAVVAAPVLSRNLLEALAARPAFTAGSRATVRFLWGLSGLAVLGLLVAAWPGWLQPVRGPRRLAFEPDPGLVRLARQVASWQQEGRLPPGTRLFCTSLESAHHLVWFCPGQRAFLDARLDLFDPDSAARFLAVRRGLRGEQAGADEEGWREPLRRHGVGLVLVHDSDRERFYAAFRRLYFQPGEWDLLSLEGNAALFGWRGGPGGPVTAPRLDSRRLLVHPPPEQRAPQGRPARDPQPRELAADFYLARPAHSPDRDEAWLRLRLFDEQRGAYLARNRALWEFSLGAALAGLAPGTAGPAAAGLDVALRLHLQRSAPRLGQPLALTPVQRLVVQMRLGFVAHREQGPTAQLVLAIRAGRRALHADPDDALAWLLLGRAYQRLVEASPEGAADGLPRLRRLRQAQACAAYQETVRLRPDLVEANEALAALYGQLGYLDLRLEQLQAVLRLRRAGGTRRGEDARAHAGQVQLLAAAVDDLAAEVRKRRDAHEANAGNLRVLVRAQDALMRGLARRALDVLLGSDTAAFGPAGARLELELLVLTGRGRDARDWLTEDLAPGLGAANCHQVALLIHATQGDYALAQHDLNELLRQADTLPGPNGKPVSPCQAVGLGVGQALLEHRPPRGGPGQLALQACSQALGCANMPRMLLPLREQATLQILRGLLALEQGDTELARRALGLARAAADGGVPVAPDLVRWWYDVLSAGPAERR
jgi:tetratricopeptide (TPR) repeat protein